MPMASAISRACRALRLPFLGASLLPFAAGAAQSGATRGWQPLGWGALAVAATHLAANLVNELADDASGADAQDPVRYVEFGGSKLLQRGELTRRWYLRAAGLLMAAALLALLRLALLLHSPWPLLWGGGAMLLAGAYSAPPARLMARGWGEATTALLFGPATVLAGWSCGTAAPPGAEIHLLAAALGLLTANVLAVNEVPDAAGDARVGKRTLVARLGAARGWLLQALLCGAAAALLATAAWRRRPANVSLLLAALLAVGLGVAMALRLRRHCDDKPALVAASRLAAALHGAVALLIAVDGLYGGAA